MATVVATRTAREYLRVSKGKGKAARSITDQHRDPPGQLGCLDQRGRDAAEAAVRAMR